MEMTKRFKKMCLERGIEYIEKPNGHIQLKGPLMVNYYPNSKNKSAYVAGTTKAVKNVTFKQAIDMCFFAPTAQKKPDKRSGHSRKKRAQLIKRGITHCCWCNSPLTLDTSTLEHIIPLASGGLDNANNRTLACLKCNNDRGSNMPELDHGKKAKKQ
jgi:hypothetical protein